MKALLIIAAIFIFISCQEADPKASALQAQTFTNPLLINGDVEAGSGTPNGWWYLPIGSYQHAWSEQESFSPSRSLKIEIAAADPVDFTFWSQTYQGSIPVGKDVVLTVKIKGELTGTGVSIAIRGDDTTVPSGNGEQFVSTQSIQSISGTFDWTTHSVKLSNVSASLKSITIYFVYLPGTAGKVYFDDAELNY